MGGLKYGGYPEIAQKAIEGANVTCLKMQKISEKLNGSDFEPSKVRMHIPTCDIDSLDGFLSYLRIPPVSRYQNISFEIIEKIIYFSNIFSQK